MLFWTKRLSQEIGEKLVLPASGERGLQSGVAAVTPLVWIFLAIISVLVLCIVLIALVLRARWEACIPKTFLATIHVTGTHLVFG